MAASGPSFSDRPQMASSISDQVAAGQAAKGRNNHSRVKRTWQRNVRASRAEPTAVVADDVWPGPEPNEADQLSLKNAMQEHKNVHTDRQAAESIWQLYAIMKDLDEQKHVIPNRNAMQVYLQHCCVKSACFHAEEICFEAANLGLDMMEKHRCGFEMSAVIQIVLQISLRASMSNTVSFVRNLVRKALRNRSENELSFIVRHMTFALAERNEATHESLSSSHPFKELGIRLDYENSSAGEFRLYNTCDGDQKFYRPVEGYGFAKKGLVALLSIDLEPSSVMYAEYRRQRDGAIVDICEANEGMPLIARLRTPVSVPFQDGMCYRLDNVDISEVQTKRILESLKVLGRDPHPQCGRQLPHSALCEMLFLPPEEPYTVRINLRPKTMPLDNELDVCEYGTEPIRVRSIGTGVFREWNSANPGKAIHVGDRVLKVNGEKDKEAICDELRHAHTWSKYTLNITFLRKVKMHEYGLDPDVCLPNAEDIESTCSKHGDSLRKKLNTSQVDAVLNACTRRLSLMQGPPGTGKTTTAVELLDFIIEHKLVPTPILVSGHTNAAIDNILVGLARKGRQVVRIGEGDKIREECRPYVLGEEMAAEPWKADVVCATCIGSGSGVFHKHGLRFHTVLIDECSQATETSCLVPLCHAAQQLILVGDQCQLQPFVKSDLVKHEDLGVSLFNRFCQQGVRPSMLTTQYRMHPLICEFPSEAFYNGQLLSGVAHTDRTPTSYWQWPSRHIPVCFIDAKDGYETESDGKAEKSNLYEVNLVASVIRELTKDPVLRSVGGDGTYPVGIVTPYAAQRELIAAELQRQGFVDLEGKQLIETNSIDGFQGREKELIVFSAVRANDEGAVGFLHDWRRINVMLTRARRGLIIIGHRETLQTDFFWNNWLKWAAMSGCIQGGGAGGKWIPKCLVEDEWVMKRKDVISKLPIDSSHRLGNRMMSAQPSLVDMPDQERFEEVLDNWENLNEQQSDSCSSHGTGSDGEEQPTKSVQAGPDPIMLRKSRSTGEPEVECWEQLFTSWSKHQDVEDHHPGETDEASTCIEEASDDCWEGSSTLSQAADDEIQRIDIPLGPLEKKMVDEGDATAWADRISAEGVGRVVIEPRSFNLLDASEIDKPSSHKNDLNCDRRSGEVLPMASEEHLMAAHARVARECYKPDRQDMTTLPNYVDTNLSYGAQGWADVAMKPAPLQTFVRFQTEACQPVPTEMVDSNAECLQAGNLQVWVDASGSAWMPMMVPVECFKRMSQESRAVCCSAVLSPGISMCEDDYGPVTMQMQSAMQSAHLQHQLRDTALERIPKPEVFACSVDKKSGTILAEWHVDDRLLQGNSRNIVSPAFDYSSGDHRPVVVFKLMIQPSIGRNFAKSKGYGTVKIKCETSLQGFAPDVKFVLSVGTDRRGPAMCDFSLHSVGELPKGNDVWNFRSNIDPHSSTVLVRLEMMSSGSLGSARSEIG